MQGNEFLLGVNYWPSKKAMLWWKDFDAEEVANDFNKISALELNSIRIFLLWEDFQPAPNYISSDALKKLEKVCDIASSNELKLIITIFTGHMSGANWVPEWALDKHTTFPKGIRYYPTITNLQVSEYQIRNMYKDELMLEAEKLQVKTIVSKFSKHPAVWGWDLSNEPSNLCIPRARDLRKWLILLADEIRSLDPSHPIILGTHSEDLEINTKFYPWIVGSICDYMVVHGYPVYSKWVKNPLDSDMLPFLCALTESMGGKPVIVEEFGAPAVSEDFKKEIKCSKIYTATEDEQARYYKETLQKIYEFGSRGALAWCYADYDKSLWGKPPLDEKPHERFFGITRSDGTLKLAAKVLKEFAYKGLEVKTSSKKLNFSKKTHYSKPLERITWYYQKYSRNCY